MASDIFIKLGDIKGESTDASHKDEIEVLAWSWGVSNSSSIGSGGGGGEGKANFQDLSFTHKVDKASPNLLLACATGDHIKDGTITNRKAGKGQQEFLIFKLTEVLITSVQEGGSSGGDELTENISLQAAKIEFEYHAQKTDGTLDAALYFKYNLTENKSY